MTTPKRIQSKAWLTSGEAAARVGISVFRLNRYQQLGWIAPTYTLGGRRRFSVEEIDALITRRGQR